LPDFFWYNKLEQIGKGVPKMDTEIPDGHKIYRNGKNTMYMGMKIFNPKALQNGPEVSFLDHLATLV
jgi:hypothetical protein